MPRLRFIIVVLFLTPVPAVADCCSPDPMANFRNAVVERGLRDLDEEVEETLLDSGLAQTDVDRIIGELAENLAECVIEILEEHSQKTGISLETLVTADEGAPKEHNAALVLLTSNGNRYCYTLALEQAGLTPP